MSKSLLVADDSLTIRKVIGMVFATEDFQITAVDNGLEAIARARELKPDLVLADVMMPGKSGYEVCEAIKSDLDTQHIPVLLLAGTFEPFDESRARGVRADDYIVKPFESQVLLDKVRTLTGVPRPAEIPRQVFVPESSSAAAKAAHSIGAVLGSGTPAPVAMPGAPQPLASSPAARMGGTGYATTPGSPRPVPGGPPAPAAMGRPRPGPMPQPGLPRAPVPMPSGYPAAPGMGLGTPQYRPPTGAVPRAPAGGMPAPGMAGAASPYGYRPGVPGAVAQASPAPMRQGMPSPAPGGSFPRSPAQSPTQQMPAPGAYAPVPQARPPYPKPPQQQMRPADGGEAALRDALSKASRQVIEKIAWEVVPQLAEAIIREHVDKLVKDREGRS